MRAVKDYRATSLEIGFAALIAAIFSMVALAAAAYPFSAAEAQTHRADADSGPGACRAASCLIQESYSELLNAPPNFKIAPAEIESERQQIAKAEAACGAALAAASGASKEGAAACALAGVPIPARASPQAEIELTVKLALLAFDVLRTKLEILARWPAEEQQIKQSLHDGSYVHRRWGDVKDIGFRDVAAEITTTAGGRQSHSEPSASGSNTENSGPAAAGSPAGATSRTGSPQSQSPSGAQSSGGANRDELAELREAGLLPPELNDPKVYFYVRIVAMRVAAHSDLRIPLKVTILDSGEAGAFALPQGNLVIERGLLEAADDEAELAGVIGQAIGEMELSGPGAGGDQAAAAITETRRRADLLRAGFGFGAIAEPRLLPSQAGPESDTDRLGIQYSWNAGYNPSGLLRFFDKMDGSGNATWSGRAGWLRTQPASYQRIANIAREMQYLPERLNAVKQTPGFSTMQTELSEREAKPTGGGRPQKPKRIVQGPRS